MSRYSVLIWTRLWETVDTSPVTLTPLRWEAQATGGHTLATIEATGQPAWLWQAAGWLGYHVQIVNEHQTPVWWGMITRAQLNTGKTRITIDLADVRNRLLVDYSYTDGDGVAQEGATAWAQDAASVARYGAQEERVPLSDTDEDTAEAKRDTWLTKSALPQPTVEWDDSEAVLQLECSGYWPLIDNVYYTNDLGRLVYDESHNVEHLLGWRVTDDWTLGFCRRVGGNRIHDLNARLHGLTEGTKLDVTGTTLNNRSFTVTGLPEEGSEFISLGPDYDIYFSHADELHGPEESFTGIRVSEMISILGTDDDVGHEDNNGYWYVQTLEPGNPEVWAPARLILDSATGQPVIIQQGHSVLVEEPPQNENPGVATFTLESHGVRIGQSFQITGSTAWDIHEAMVRVRKVGAPTGALYFRLYSDSAGTPTTLLAAGSVAAADIRTINEWVTCIFGTPYTLQPATTYWITVSAETTPANMTQDCYAIGLTNDPDAQYAGGAVKVQIVAGSWESRWGDAVSMPFQVWGRQDTGTQILEILTTASPYLAGGYVRTASGVYRRQYRDGMQRAMYEAQELVEVGNTAALRLSVDITPQRLAVVGVETAEDAVDTSLAPRFDVVTGKLNRPDGGPMEPGVLPYGQTVMLDNVLDTHDYFSRLERVTVERVEYDAEKDGYRMESRQRRQPWEVS